MKPIVLGVFLLFASPGAQQHSDEPPVKVCTTNHKEAQYRCDCLNQHPEGCKAGERVNEHPVCKSYCWMAMCKCCLS